jgi:hypothetical protein
MAMMMTTVMHKSECAFDMQGIRLGEGGTTAGFTRGLSLHKQQSCPRIYKAYPPFTFQKKKTMSAYFDIPVETSTVVCTRCKTPTFGWLAEVFSCSECEGNDFAPTEDEEADSDISIKDSSGAADIANENKKGKRPMSDTGSP